MRAQIKKRKMLWSVVLAASVALAQGSVMADEHDDSGGKKCADLPSYQALTGALDAVVNGLDGANGGLGNDMWATVVNRDGAVCVVTRSGDDRGDQWPGSRVISAQKANTANAFSLPQAAKGFPFPLSTANIYSPVQPGGSLFGLQFSNPVDTSVAYRGNAKQYGTSADPMRGGKIGGINVFGGGLALYDTNGKLIGAIGVSGDTSCADHVIAWKVRHRLNLDNVAGGVSDSGTDNIIFFGSGETFDPAFGHPICGFGADVIAGGLPTTHPVGPAP